MNSTRDTATHETTSIENIIRARRRPYEEQIAEAAQVAIAGFISGEYDIVKAYSKDLRQIEQDWVADLDYEDRLAHHDCDESEEDLCFEINNFFDVPHWDEEYRHKDVKFDGNMNEHISFRVFMGNTA